MEPRINDIKEKKLVGKSLRMSVANDRTPELWRSFMPFRKAIGNAISSDLICMQVYDADKEFKDFTINTEFEKWAAVEVYNLDSVPEGLQSYTLKGGLYAVFDYKGRPSDFADTWRYIFYDWLPNSEYEVDKREHFEVLGEKYKNNDPDSEEEIWVPIRRKD